MTITFGGFGMAVALGVVAGISVGVGIKGAEIIIPKVMDMVGMHQHPQQQPS
jgi:hypothetical protein